MEEKDIKREFIYNIPSPELSGRMKRVRVFLPEGYDDSHERYPVLYMHDGQNLVGPSPYSGYSWDVLRTSDRLARENIAGKLIIVGIDCDNKRRVMEYSGALTNRYIRKFTYKMPKEEIYPEGRAYADFIVNRVKPFVDENYRTLTDRFSTGVAGSSCGGIISLYMECWYKEVFGIIGAFSPALEVVGKDLLDLLEKTDIPDGTKIYHDMGTKEGRFSLFTVLRYSHLIQKVLEKKLKNPEFLMHVIDKSATHTELFWQSRFPDFLAFSFPKSQ